MAENPDRKRKTGTQASMPPAELQLYRPSYLAVCSRDSRLYKTDRERTVQTATKTVPRH